MPSPSSQRSQRSSQPRTHDHKYAEYRPRSTLHTVLFGAASWSVCECGGEKWEGVRRESKGGGERGRQREKEEEGRVLGGRIEGGRLSGIMIWTFPFWPRHTCVHACRAHPHPSTHLLVLQLDAHDPEGVAGSVVVDVDAAEALLARLDGHPLLTGIIVHHHGSPGLADTLFAADKRRKHQRSDQGWVWLYLLRLGWCPGA